MMRRWCFKRLCWRMYQKKIMTSSISSHHTLFHKETHSQDEGPSTSTALSAQSGRSVTFTDLISVPQRERAIRKRLKPPSYNLTSEQHIEYIKTKKSSSKQPAKQASKYLGSKQPKGKKKQGKRSKSPCKVCNTHYGDPNDPKATEEWVKCDPCSAWFHESCGEENGICDDDGFICKDLHISF